MKVAVPLVMPFNACHLLDDRQIVHIVSSKFHNKYPKKTDQQKYKQETKPSQKDCTLAAAVRYISCYRMGITADMTKVHGVVQHCLSNG